MSIKIILRLSLLTILVNSSCSNIPTIRTNEEINNRLIDRYTKYNSSKRIITDTKLSRVPSKKSRSNPDYIIKPFDNVQFVFTPTRRGQGPFGKVSVQRYSYNNPHQHTLIRSTAKLIVPLYFLKLNPRLLIKPDNTHLKEIKIDLRHLAKAFPSTPNSDISANSEGLNLGRLKSVIEKEGSSLANQGYTLSIRVIPRLHHRVAVGEYVDLERLFHRKDVLDDDLNVKFPAQFKEHNHSSKIDSGGYYNIPKLGSVLTSDQFTDDEKKNGTVLPSMLDDAYYRIPLWRKKSAYRKLLSLQAATYYLSQAKNSEFKHKDLAIYKDMQFKYDPETNELEGIKLISQNLGPKDLVVTYKNNKGEVFSIPYIHEETIPQYLKRLSVSKDINLPSFGFFNIYVSPRGGRLEKEIKFKLRMYGKSSHIAKKVLVKPFDQIEIK